MSLSSAYFDTRGDKVMIDFPLNLRDRDENWAWYKGSLWLSLDRFERFWPDVGLALANGEAVKSAVRAAHRAQYAIDAKGRETDEDDLDYMDHIEELARACFRSINETAGVQDAECVARWLTGPVLAELKEPSWHHAWRLLLYRMPEEDTSALSSRYGIPGDTARRIVEIAARFRSEADACDERIQAADLEPLSGWDAVAYGEYRREASILSPFDGLGLHLKCIYFDRTWPEIMRCMRPADIDALIQWGRAQLTPKLGMPEHEAIIPEHARGASREST
jgi:hypothetical protein